MRGVWPVFVVLACVVLALGYALSAFELKLDDTRIQQAAVAATLVVLGWFVTFALTEWREARSREQKSRDIQSAFNAELIDYSVSLDDGDHDMVIEALEKRVRADASTVFFPLVSDPVIFNSLTSEVTFLPGAVIDDVIQFYSMLSDVQLFANELRSDAFANVTVGGKLDACRDYIAMRAEAALLALQATVAISESLKSAGSRPEEIAYRKQRSERAGEILGWISKQDAGHDDPAAS